MHRHLLFFLTTLRLIGRLHAQEPVHHWSLDEDAGTIAHEVASGEDGSLVGTYAWQPGGGRHGGALRFNSANASAIAGPCDLTAGNGASITLACWFEPSAVGAGERVLLGKTIGPLEQDFVWSLSLVNGTGARFRLRAAGVVHTLEVPAGNILTGSWYHLAGTYDGTTMTLYLNGFPVDSQPVAGIIGLYPQAPASLGNLVTDPRPFDGSLDDVRIYDLALEAAEVLELVAGPSTVGIGPSQEEVILSDNAIWNQAPYDRMLVYDLAGHLLADAPYRSAPIRPLEGSLPTGTYLVCLQRGAEQQVKRVHLP